MYYPIFLALIGIIPSWLLMRAIENCAKDESDRELRRWQRLLIPVPMMFFLIANLDGVFSLAEFLQSNPEKFAIRYKENQAWSADRFFYPGLAVLIVLPFVLVPARTRNFHLFMVIWGGHLLWIIFPLGVVLLSSGVPFRD